LKNNPTIAPFETVAENLGLGRLSDGEDIVTPEAAKRLYRHARGESGPPAMFSNDQTFARRWINLSAPEVRELLEPFAPVDEEEDPRKYRNLVRTTLEAVSWNDTLGIPAPPIRCHVKIHGKKWGLRFESGEPAMKGKEEVNEQLPPIPDDPGVRGGDEVEPPGEDPRPPAVSTAVRRAPASDTGSEVEATLEKAGMPS